MPYTGPEPARRPLSSDDITDGIISTADLADSAVTTAKLANNGVTAAKVSSDVSQLGKSLIQNGAMTVAQRGTSFANADGYTLDRWQQVDANSTTAEATITQDTTAPSGFAYSLKIDVTATDVSIAADDLWALRTKIEAQNLQHLDYGAATAKTVTASFYVRSNKTGTYSAALFQPDGTRTYPFTYTVDSANTFEKKTVTISGDASGTINADTGSGLELVFMFLGGSNRVGTADAWGAGQFYGVTGGNNLFDDTSNEFYLTGVQLEVGSVATDFEWEDISTTLAKCQRYYEQHDFDGENQQNISLVKIQTAASTTTGFKYLTQKRAAPTITFSAANTFVLEYNGTTTSGLASISADHITDQQCRVVPSVSSGLPIDEVAMWCRDATDTAFMKISAEL